MDNLNYEIRHIFTTLIVTALMTILKIVLLHFYSRSRLKKSATQVPVYQDVELFFADFLAGSGPFSVNEVLRFKVFS